MSDDNEKEVQDKADAAIKAMFALEESLGPSGSPLRQRVYQARIIVSEVKYAVRKKPAWP